ncbi:hypothetical protein M406DRAFT_335175 [Cryphonectria parasitica EP155]|uniref:Cyanovirin-N domain-containing protein n=1 Tax=Cryphonectria parasitica (strain ATCC 38755 / EP155) TaxID=660469 RepID=A0A9P5CH29_CRYP1|nr:uncharacterized protein M406DRAFT_335175 [Cryphonectria parasitica EP155]KAF3759964.1 hypothetical protein M406DRAFT_335175 [Cryphonectria parasitica EP155]
MLFSSSLAFLTLAPLFLCVPTVLATSGFSSTCANYYLGNGVSDGTGELFIEAWCHGGLMYDGTPYSGKCSRLSLAECFKSVGSKFFVMSLTFTGAGARMHQANKGVQDDGELEPLDQDTDLYHRDIATGCDIESCAIRGDAWDGPIMTCYCQGSSGQWTLASIDLVLLKGGAWRMASAAREQLRDGGPEIIQ